MGTATETVVVVAAIAMVAVYTVDDDPMTHVTATRREDVVTAPSAVSVSVTELPAVCCTVPAELASVTVRELVGRFVLKLKQSMA